MPQQRSCCVLQYYYRPLYYNKEEHAAQVSNVRTALAGLYVSIMDSNTLGILGQDTCHTCVDRLSQRGYDFATEEYAK